MCITVFTLGRRLLLLLEDRPAGGPRALARWVLVGLVVLLLSVGPLATSAQADTAYKVQPGDTLIGIAARFGVTVDAIITANSLPSRSTIYPRHAPIHPLPLPPAHLPTRPPNRRRVPMLCSRGTALSG